MKKYLAILKICLAERFAYRTDFFSGILMRFLPIVTTIFLWSAIYSGSGKEQIAQLSSNDMVAYYLLVFIARAFSSMPGLASSIATDVRDGHIKRYLIQPIDLIGLNFVSRIAHKVVYYSIAIGPFCIVFFLCGNFFEQIPSLETWIAFILSLLMGFCIGFLFELCIGLISFWVLEISSISFIVITLNYVVSGHMFSLDLIPGWIGEFVRVLPFQYLAFYPAKIFLHGDLMSSYELWRGIAIEFSICIAMYVIARMMLHMGLKRYSAFGG